MKNFATISICLFVFQTTSSLYATLLTSVPGPDDQGGMIMPMVSIVNTDNPFNPTRGQISIAFNPNQVPVFRSLQEWNPGGWFSEAAAWRPSLSSPVGIGGTPPANAGAGSLFNNQYGFMFMAMPMMGTAYVPEGKSLGIKLTSLSSPALESYNYGNADNRWDQVFSSIDSQVLWDGTMWHNYFTLPADAAPGTYTASFEIFIANQAFSSGTGFADYSPAALSATKDENFTSAFVNYTWVVVPEPTTWALMVVALAGLGLASIRRKRLKGPGSR